MEPPADAPPEPGPPAPPEAAPADVCPRCGAPHDRLQEYCLECGARLVPLYGGTRWIARRELWARDSPLWLWTALAALLLVALVSGAIVALAATEDQPAPKRRQAAPGATSSLQILTDVTTATLPDTATVIPTTATTVPTLPTDTTNQTTTGQTTTDQTTTGTTTTGDTIMRWPAAEQGFTVILASVTTSGGRSRAEAKAREAIAAGLSQVGVLASSDYSSLRPGYYAVFMGVYDTKSGASSAVPTAEDAGYDAAYVREIAP